ncbi:uncharacterized protein V6R79_016147 [Siganus canaliculatus]
MTCYGGVTTHSCPGSEAGVAEVVAGALLKECELLVEDLLSKSQQVKKPELLCHGSMPKILAAAWTDGIRGFHPLVLLPTVHSVSGERTDFSATTSEEATAPENM